MLSFRAERWARVVGRGWVALVRCSYRPRIVGHRVMIDDRVYTCTGVEGTSPSNGRLGILVRGEPAAGTLRDT